MRRRKRLKQRAKQLSDTDLLAVISLRNHEKTVARGEQESKKDTESDPGDLGAGPSSCGAAPQASAQSSSKKKRHA